MHYNLITPHPPYCIQCIYTISWGAEYTSEVAGVVFLNNTGVLLRPLAAVGFARPALAAVMAVLFVQSARLVMAVAVGFARTVVAASAKGAGEKFDSDVVWPRVGGVVHLRFGVVFFSDVSIVEVLISKVSIYKVSISKVSISDVLAIREGVVNVSIVTYIIAVIDTAVAKVMEEARVFWPVACARSSSGGGGSRARLFVVNPWRVWRVWRVSLACMMRGPPVLAARDGVSGAACVLSRAAVVQHKETEVLSGALRDSPGAVDLHDE